MAVISIVGTSGVGKSFFVKQLASYKCCPAFFEGEEGVIPKEILDDVFAKGDPVKRWKWFLDRRQMTLSRAKSISGMDCFVDGDAMTAEAILADEEKRYHPALKKLLEPFKNLEPDTTLVLTANKSTIEKLFRARGRETDDHPKAMERAIRIQDEFIRLAKGRKNTLVLDRDGLDFSKEEDLRMVYDLLFSPAHAEDLKGHTFK